jgi:hypothetical protein
VDACNPLLQAHPTWARDKHEGHGISTSLSPVAFSPLRAPSRADPSGLGHATTFHSSVQGPPGLETPTDLLAKSAGQGLPLPSKVFFETIKAPSIDLLERAVLNISPVYSEDWRTEIMSFLQGNFLSVDEAYNKRIAARARPYVIIEGEFEREIGLHLFLN